MENIKSIIIQAEGKMFTIRFKDTKPKETVVYDEKGKEYFRKAKSLLRKRVKELGLSQDGYLYTNGKKEAMTHEYFRKVWEAENK